MLDGGRNKVSHRRGFFSDKLRFEAGPVETWGKFPWPPTGAFRRRDKPRFILESHSGFLWPKETAAHELAPKNGNCSRKELSSPTGIDLVPGTALLHCLRIHGITSYEPAPVPISPNRPLALAPTLTLHSGPHELYKSSLSLGNCTPSTDFASCSKSHLVCFQ